MTILVAHTQSWCRQIHSRMPCLSIQQATLLLYKTKALLNPIPIDPTPFANIAVDLLGLFPNPKAMTWFLSSQITLQNEYHSFQQILNSHHSDMQLSFAIIGFVLSASQKLSLATEDLNSYHISSMTSMPPVVSKECHLPPTILTPMAKLNM